MIEGTGEKFNQATYFRAREICIQAVDRICSQVQDGFTHEDGQALVKEVFANLGVAKFWHPTKFRIGSDTVKNFREEADSSIVTQKGDICFVDVGPIIEDHEADFGRTFLVENFTASNRLIDASVEVFRRSSHAWKSQGLTGAELLDFADRSARELGFEINPKMAGHRLGDFPHHVFYKKSLFELQQRPVENLWVLEIHLLDRAAGRGAFFEDILV